MSNVIDALKRLERAGAEDSRATQRLVEAAAVLGEHLRLEVLAGVEPTDAYGEATELPRGYSLGPGGYTWRPEEADWGSQRLDLLGREDALAFARDVATGWLDELAAWLEKRAAESDGSAERLEAEVRQ